MTTEQLLLLIAAIPATIASITAAIVAIITARRTKVIEAQATVIAEKQSTLAEKTAVIHTLTNSSLSLAEKKLEVAIAQRDGLQRLVDSLASAKLVADRVAEFTPPVGVAELVNGVTTAIDRAVAAVPPLAPNKETER